MDDVCAYAAERYCLRRLPPLTRGMLRPERLLAHRVARMVRLPALFDDLVDLRPVEDRRGVPLRTEVKRGADGEVVFVAVTPEDAAYHDLVFPGGWSCARTAPSSAAPT